MPVAYGSLPFAEQIAFFRQKVNLGTQRWDDILGAAHDRAFVVAGAAKADLLADLRAAVTKAIEDGTTLATFRQDFEALVARNGWTGWTGEGTAGGRAWRTRVIYETNLRASYAAGRWAQIQQVKAERPYLLYRHNDNVLHPRPLHQSWDGKVIPADDPWWRTHFPPNGWGCQCRVHAVDDAYLRKLGKAGPDPAPDDGTYDYFNKVSGVTLRDIPKGIDPGWDYAPGASLDPQAFIRDKAAKLPGQIARQFVDAVEDHRSANQAVMRVASAIRNETDQLKQKKLALDWIDQHVTKIPKPVKNHGMGVDEQHVSITWEGTKFTFMPSALSGGKENLAQLMVEIAQRSLPRRLTKHVKYVNFSTQANIHDTHWEQVYNIPGFKSAATGGGDGIVVYNDRPLTGASFIHEAGHLLARSKWASADPPPSTDFYKATVSGESPPTTYGEAAIAEDFAESVKLYFEDRRKLKKIAPRRYAIIKRLMEDDNYHG